MHRQNILFYGTKFFLRQFVCHWPSWHGKTVFINLLVFYFSKDLSWKHFLLLNFAWNTIINRYRIFKDQNVTLVTIGIGLCSFDDSDSCIVFVNLLDKAVLPVPTCIADGTLVWPEGKCSWCKLNSFNVNKIIELLTA